MAFQAGAIIAELSLDSSKFHKGISGAMSSSNGLVGTLMSLGKTAGIAAAGLVAGAATAAGAMITQGIKGAAAVEQQEVAFTTLLGSAEAAKSAIEGIKQDAIATPFQLPGLIQGNQMLIAAGVSAERARKDFLGLGNAVAAVGGSDVELTRMASNLQQIRAVGNATAADIKQFGNVGIPIYDLLADSMGKTVEQVAAMDATKFTYDDITAALNKASEAGGRFEGAMEKQSQTFNGVMSNIKDTFSLALTDIVRESGLFDAVTQGLKWFYQVFEDNKEVLIQFAQNGIQVVVEKLTTMKDWFVDNQQKFIDFKDKIVTVKDGLIEVKEELTRVFSSGDIDEQSHFSLLKHDVPDWVVNTVERLGELKMTIDENGGIFETLKKKWEEFKDTPLGQIVDNALQSFRDLAPVFKDELLPAIKDAMPEIKQFFGILLENYKEGVLRQVGIAIGIVALALTGLAKAIELGMRFLAWYIPKWQYAADAILNFKENVIRLKDDALALINIKIQEVRDKINELIEKVKESEAYQKLSDIITTIKENFNTWIATLKLAWENVVLVKDIIVELKNIAMQALNEKIDEVKQKIGDVLNPILEAGKQKFNEVKDAVMGVVNTVIDHFRPAAESVTEKMGETKEKTEEARSKFQEWKDRVAEYIDRIKEKADELRTRISERFDEIKEKFQPLIDKVQELWDSFRDKFGKIATKVTDVVTPLLRLRETLQGILGTLRGISGASEASTGAVRSKSGFASGGVNIPGGVYDIGERGREKMYVPDGSTIIPHNEVMQQEKMGGGRSGPVLQIQNMTVNGGSEHDIMSIAQKLDQMIRLQGGLL